MSRIMSLLTCFLLFLIPYATSLTFNLSNITPKDNQEIITTDGGAYISEDGIQVTPEFNRQLQNRTVGRATYIKPLHLWDKNSSELASFSTSFSFVIDSNLEANYGDGLTFFLAQNRSKIELNMGEYYGVAMGLPVNVTTNLAIDQFVAVEFDTTYDPQVDQTPHLHVGIDIHSLISVRYQNWYGNMTHGKECQAWINYDSLSQVLDVSFTGFRNNIAFRQVGLNYVVDLRNVLPEWVIFGFSAATRPSAFEKNIVKSWTFSSSDLHIDESKGVPPATSPNPVKGKKKGTGYMVGLIAGGCVAFAMLAMVGILCWRKMKNKGDEVEDDGSALILDNEFEKGTGPRKFSYQELARSTDDFAEDRKLGEGGFGGVYRGFLKELGTDVAVKQVSKTSKQGNKEYASEVRIISRLRHKNLVQLKGWCHEKRDLLLVYEFMENGSLDLHLFKGKSLLTWCTRYRIAHGLASALFYLHEEWEQCVLHRDIKSSNVMLDSSFNAKLGDFGLAKLVDHEKGAHTTMLAGTFGYMAPECAVTGKATRESDVFSYGVVALEIACGRRTIECKDQENQIRLVDWVWELYGTETLLEGVDPKLGSDYDEEEVKRLMIVGLWCVHPDSDLRPSMRQVIQVLNSEASLPILPSEMPPTSYMSKTQPSYCSTSNSGSSKQTTSSTVSSTSLSSLKYSRPIVTIDVANNTASA